MPSPDFNTNVAGGAGASASTTAPSPPPLGTLIDDGTSAGALQLAAVLGYGGYGVVYRAVDATSNTTHPTSYAVKCLVQSQTRSSTRQRRLHMQEITLHQLASAHPHVVSLHRVIEEDGFVFIVMDFCIQAPQAALVKNNLKDN